MTERGHPSDDRDDQAAGGDQPAAADMIAGFLVLGATVGLFGATVGLFGATVGLFGAVYALTLPLGPAFLGAVVATAVPSAHRAWANDSSAGVQCCRANNSSGRRPS